ncbi:MAG: hypothetical protein QXH20_01530 [Candidatus Bathyarchaeia archaeon]
METEIVMLISAIIGALIVAIIYEARRKIWYLETLSPRQHFVLGKEKGHSSHGNRRSPLSRH